MKEFIAKKFNRKENSAFPIKLKLNSEAWDQKEHFLNLKAKFEELANRDKVINSLIEQQVSEFHSYINYILKKATIRELNEDDLEIVRIAQDFVVQCSMPQKLSNDKLLDLLFKLYMETAMYIDKFADEQTESIAYYSDGQLYAARIYNSFKSFVREVNEEQSTKIVY
ncbi:hypothetical protein ACOYX3_17395 [Enterococcus entomosocium]|uniref:hypothetical protein n=1 Tax=Enterococcus entomosocium TaxID=3034352 RepID=UPI003BCA7BE9